MKIALNVLNTPLADSSYRAYQFACAAIKAGHELVRVFFYQDGVYNGNDLASPPQDEINLPTLWQQLSRNHGVELCICVASAIRRGVLDKATAENNKQSQCNLAPGFSIVGLGHLMDAAQQADRLITFG